MGVFEMVVAVVLIGTVGKVLQAFAQRGARPRDDGRLGALEATLGERDLRLAQAEERIDELGEKLVFMEPLLAAPGAAPRIGGERPGGNGGSGGEPLS